MKKKYKHKLTGKVFEETDNGYYYHLDITELVPYYFIENSNDWEEIIDTSKTYKILSFKYNGELSTLRDNGRYVYEKVQPKDCPDGKGATLEEMLDEQEYPGRVIHSVIRLSDSKIFTIEDKIDVDILKNRTILGFRSYDKYKNIWVVTFYGSTPLHLIQPSNPVIFVTDDNVNVYKGDAFFFVDTYLQIGEGKLIANKFTKIDGYKHFSTKQAAEDYIAKKKVLFVTEDGVGIRGGEYVFYVNSTYDLHCVNVYQICGLHSSVKWFFAKEKAQEYIDMNKPMYSKQQIFNAWETLKWFTPLKDEIIREMNK